MKNFKVLVLLALLLGVILALVNLQVGYISIPWRDFLSPSEHDGIIELRINRVFLMLLAGVSIPTSGFLLQEYFQNPLAGPSVLGITSVASLCVAMYIFFFNDWEVGEIVRNGLLSVFAIGGSMLMLLVLLGFSKKFKDKSFLIIFGFLISALSGAIISIMQLYANNQSLKNYILWSFGSQNQVNSLQLIILTVLILLGLILSFYSIKPLIGSALGDSYARVLGVNLNNLKYLIIAASSLLSASVTAFMGPVLFIGIVVPHFCRLIYNPALLWQQWILNMLVGILIMVAFSILSELTLLPINVITSVFGIPIILLMLLKSKN